MSNSSLILIPARMASTRLPGKPLADIAGLPMVVHVLQRAIKANVGRVVVATDTEIIYDVVKSHGGEAVMTGCDHQSGSDRIWEAAKLLDPDGAVDIIVNLQGDFPTLEPELLRHVVGVLQAGNADIATLAAPIVEAREREDENVPKVVATPPGAAVQRALYFSRATIPAGPGPLLHHIGVYAYRRAALQRFVSLPLSALERRERLEQLRALEAGMHIDVAIADTVPLGVDTQDDLERARALLAPR